MVRPLWCDRYGAATMVCTIRRWDSMVQGTNSIVCSENIAHGNCLSNPISNSIAVAYAIHLRMCLSKQTDYRNSIQF